MLVIIPRLVKTVVQPPTWAMATAWPERTGADHGRRPVDSCTALTEVSASKTAPGAPHSTTVLGCTGAAATLTPSEMRRTTIR
jgi:hypothetical protein